MKTPTEKKVEELDELIKKLEFSYRWKVINNLPFENIIKTLNDYIDLIEGRKNDLQ